MAARTGTPERVGVADPDRMNVPLSRNNTRGRCARARVEDGLGIVTVHEHIFTEVGQERHSGAAVSTNIFAFDGNHGDWRLFHHHASNTALPAEPEQGPLN